MKNILLRIYYRFSECSLTALASRWMVKVAYKNLPSKTLNVFRIICSTFEKMIQFTQKIYLYSVCRLTSVTVSTVPHKRKQYHWHNGTCFWVIKTRISIMGKTGLRHLLANYSNLLHNPWSFYRSNTNHIWGGGGRAPHCGLAGS